MKLDLDDAISAAFLEESREGLDTFDQDLIALEAGDDVDARTARLFRTLHTIKGTCGFLGLPRLETFAHAGESLLGELREHRLDPTPEVVRALLSLGDRIRDVLDQIEANGGSDERLADEDRDTLAAVRRVATAGVVRSTDAPTTAVGQDALRPQGDAALTWAPTRSESSLRVDVGLLDRLMNLVGELGLARNQLLDRVAAAGDPRLQSATGQLDRITAELQDTVTRTRLQSVGALCTRLPRLVHDLSAELGKAATLVVEGEDTLLDKALLDAVRDPLTHLVRNAVDHGIEPPAARQAAGKQPCGRVLLRAFQEGGQVVIEVEDDGTGIDREALRRRAVELGLVVADESASLGEREVLDLLFRPGLSTRAEVTSVSGRGVGADVVRANVDRVGGTVDVATRPGLGTTFRIRIPVTLAIVSALLVVDGGATYAIAQSHVLEVVRVAHGKEGAVLRTMSGPQVLRLRGGLLPLVDVAAVLGRPAWERVDPHVVVVAVDGGRVGLLVDGVRDTGEIVVKPLRGALRRIPVYAGATVLGDGSIALILDVAGLAADSGVSDLELGASAEAAPASTRAGRDVRSHLMIRAHDGGAMAVPLDLVHRVDEIAADDIQRHGPVDAVPYGDEIMPLVAVAKLLPERRSRQRGPRPPTRQRIPVAVCRTANGLAGLAVGEIVDIVEGEVTAVRPSSRDGVAEGAVLGGRITEILDVDRLVELAENRVEAP